MRLDLVSLYGLESVAASVARNDLVTGVKLNRLRKHYEGKIKPLGLSGKNKPVRHEPGAPGGLLDLTAWPEDEWQNQKVSGKEIKIAEPETTQHKMLMRAMRMEPGPLPDNAYWDDLLAPEKPGKTGDSFRRSASVPDRGVSQRPNSLSAAPSPQPEYATSRPRRSGKKRSYHDSSFAGYGEGFFDDDGDAGSAQDDDWKGGKKKRRKDQATPPPYPPAERGGSYGVGMFGLGAR
ncbi:hypothetical protein KEM55_000539 [Ascosphaera atra]|nr:hypothetical protein KEM55_000539 [Ascosphaera atra]